MIRSLSLSLSLSSQGTLSFNIPRRAYSVSDIRRHPDYRQNVARNSDGNESYVLSETYGIILTRRC